MDNKEFTWLVTYYDCNADKITSYDVLKHREDLIKKLKKKYATKEEFAEGLRMAMMWSYWSKAEWELIIEVSDDGHIWLIPWCGCIHEKEVMIDVVDDSGFDWRGFAEKHIVKRNKAKIDVFDQLKYRWDEFVDYTWNFHHKWQRRKTDE